MSVVRIRPTETQLQMSLVQWLVLPSVERRLSCIWWHTDNTHNSLARAKQLKSMGLRAGVFDLIFLNTDTRIGFLEIKRRGEDLSDSQKKFRDWIDASAIPYAIVRTDDPDVLRHETENFLVRHGFMS